MVINSKHFHSSLSFLLPIEIQTEVFTYLPVQILIKCHYVCKQWKQILEEDTYWRVLSKRDFTFYPDPVPPITWKTHYLTISFPPKNIQNCQIICDKTLKGHTAAVECILMERGKIFSGALDKTIKIWDLAGNLLDTLEGHTSAVTGLAVRDNTLVSSANCREIKIWDLLTKTCLHTMSISSRGQVSSLGIKGNQVIATFDYEVLAWNLQTGKLEQNYYSLKKPCFIFSSNTRSIQNTRSIFLESNSISLIKNGSSHITCLNNSTGNHASIASEGDTIVTGGLDNLIRIYDIKSKKFTHKIKVSEEKNMILSVLIQGNTILTASSDKTVKIWKIKPKNLA